MLHRKQKIKPVPMGVEIGALDRLTPQNWGEDTLTVLGK